MNENKSLLTNPNFTLILIGLLLVGSFFAGRYYTKVEMYEGGSTTGTQNAQQEKSRTQKVLASINDYAKKAGANEKDFASCFENKDTQDNVQAQYQSGITAGIQGTPGNILLNTQTGQGVLVSGAQPLENFQAYIDFMLNGTPVPDNVKTLNGDVVENFNVPPVTDSDHIFGNAQGKIALIEYSDYECPYCQRFHPTAQQLVENNSDLMWVFRHFPLDNIHKDARPLAIASECVAKVAGNDAFWKFTDAVYNAQ